MLQYMEPLKLGLSSVAVYVGAALLFEASRSITAVGLSGAWIYVPGLAILGYVAGQRRSLPDLLAIVVGYLGAALVLSIARAALSI